MWLYVDNKISCPAYFIRSLNVEMVILQVMHVHRILVLSSQFSAATRTSQRIS
jgi:uncharacterized protein YhhL (DUF1145 family)